MERFEEETEISLFWSWVLIILFSACIIVYGMCVHFTIRDVPRRWDFGVLPDTPAESIYSSTPYQKVKEAPPQLPMFPDSYHRPATKMAGEEGKR